MGYCYGHIWKRIWKTSVFTMWWAFCISPCGLSITVNNMKSTLLVFIILIILGIPLAIYSVKSEKKRKNKTFAETFGSLKDFELDDYYVPQVYMFNQSFSIGFDNKNKKICFFGVGVNQTKESHVYNYNKILQCEIVVDNETTLKQSTSGTVGRAILGGVLTGGVGAIIGGVTGAKKQKETIQNIDLKIIIDDSMNPIFKVNFFSGNTPKNSIEYKNVYSKAEKWHAVLAGLIKQGDKENSNIGGSTADELHKLKSLLDSGAITQSEFEKQKNKVLA